MKKKILIDGLMLLSPFTGIGKYTFENSKRFNKDNYKLIYYYGYFSTQLVNNIKTKTLNKFRFLKWLKSLIVKNSIIKSFVRNIIFKTIDIFYKTEYDLYWMPNNLSNVKIKAKYRITTVHDLSFYIEPSWHPKERIEYFEQNFWKDILLSDRIITGSYYTKKEILQHIEYEESKIDVIYHGIDHNIFQKYSLNSMTKFKEKVSLPNNFILAVGSIEPRKNLLSLLEAYQKLDFTLKNKYKLVLVGFQGWENEDVMSLIKKDSNNILYLGYLSEIELAYIYNLASLFCYPSIYEGFGIPPLEAMACGTPVICSNTTSLPEVGGDAVVYFNPYDIDEISYSIRRVLEDSKLYQSLIIKGLLRSKKFSWELSASKHSDVFEKVFK